MSSSPGAEPGARRHGMLCLVAGLLLCIAYGCHICFCANSAMFYFPYVYQNSDMHANLLWAKSILEQGWLNPNPHHPYATWMQEIGTYEEWLRWWGGAAVFQQSPLYAYCLAAVQWVTDDLLYVCILQAVGAIGLCVVIGRISFCLSGRERDGWVAFGLAACYAPFYAYSQALLRDLPGWLVTGCLLLILLEFDRAGDDQNRRRRLCFMAGLALGLGFLARELYVLLLPLVGLLLALRLVRRRDWVALAGLTVGLGVVLTPLAIRNLRVGAPLLSTSNRSADAIIQGHAASAHPWLFVVPRETRELHEQARGSTWRVLVATLQTHPRASGLIRFEVSKLLSLFDPFEPYDNLSPYYMETVSPFNRWGLKHWFLLTPGLAGLALGVWRLDKRHFWLWAVLPALLLSLYVGTPLSRYRQALTILWIPWAAYYAGAIVDDLRAGRRTSVVMRGVVLAAGWCLCLGPLARHPKAAYERATEYQMAVHVYERLQQPAKVEQAKRVLSEKGYE